MMGKLLAVLLSVLLLMGLTATAFAADEEDPTDEEIVTASEEPEEDGDPSVIDDVFFTISAPVCGSEVTDSSPADNAMVQVEPEDIRITELELVKEFDTETLTGEPFTGIIEGGEDYAFLMTLETGESQFNDSGIAYYFDGVDEYEFFAFFPTDTAIESPVRVAVVFTAEHDWNEWEVVREATDDEAGLQQRVCRYDPSHLETETIPALSSGETPDVYLDLTFPKCGEEVDTSYAEEDEAVYLYGYGATLVDCRLVSDYDPECPDDAEPFTGSALGGEMYTFLIRLECGDGFRFNEDTKITVSYPYDAEASILEMTEYTLTLAVSAEAEHIWSEWFVEREPTDVEDGLLIRVCEGNPDHVETEIIPAETEPVNPGDPWTPDDPELFAATIEVMPPVCGDEITEDNRLEAVGVYPWPENTMAVALCELVTDYDADNPAIFTPFLGTVIGGEEYTFLMILMPDENHWFGEDMSIDLYEPYLYSWEILSRSEREIILAVTFTADHDWGDWYVETEPTEEEDGLWMRVCQFDPEHMETQIIPAGTDPYAPVPDYETVPTDDCPAVPGGVELDKGTPNTGDRSEPVIWCATAALSLAGAAALMVRGKKRANG